MRKTASNVKKFFGKKKKNVTKNAASVVAQDSGTASQVSSTYQSDTGPGPGIEVSTPTNEALIFASLTKLHHSYLLTGLVCRLVM